ncbi:CBASS oligonucleotide cyclase [Rhodococcus sp. ARC_M6]|uniref:CBASS oligonucleotide cyclase n=1 Tax=Rhodococcus sp. ARC_M6 TaxID=2928852 RepID=UPI001FB34EB3|nr:CBASS oligonucleotide cyclase [Rhodococcus sp. ARC_M6]MCJ0907024.1 hypothetical protein [Rhodococcus sp. ARC_M6]
MGLVDAAFAGLKSNLEITTGEQQLAQSRHKIVRDHVRGQWALADDFLTGSYDRHTKTKKLKDVDIFVVIDPDGPQAHLADGTGTTAVTALVDVLSTRWSDVTGDDTVALISYAGEDVTSYEVAPAFATETGFRIPNGVEWMETNPHEHARMVTEKNTACQDKFVPLVKMLKAINREAGEPLNPSFLIEVMALDLVEPDLARYQDEIRFFLASAADQITDNWPDPAKLGGDVNAAMTISERIDLQGTIRRWLATAEEAILLESEGQERAAIELWRSLFGSRMPRP